MIDPRIKQELFLILLRFGLLLIVITVDIIKMFRYAGIDLQRILW